MEKYAQIFSHPRKLTFEVAKHLLVDGVDIYEKIKTAMKDYEAGNYYACGNEIGQAINEVITGTRLN